MQTETFTSKDLMEHFGVTKHKAWRMGKLLERHGKATALHMDLTGCIVYKTSVNFRDLSSYKPNRRKPAEQKKHIDLYTNPFNLTNAVDMRWR